MLVVAGHGEAVPILVIQLHVIAPVVMPRPVRFSSEQRVMGRGLRGQQPVACEPITYGSDVVSSGLVCLGSMSCDARTAPIADGAPGNRR
jgi:hypothetical protein